MTGREDDELRRLRARAYGPAADIHLDPAAAERLRRLEEEDDGSDAQARGPDSVTSPGGTALAPSDGRSKPAAPVEDRSFGSRRVHWPLWAASLLVVIVAVSAVVVVQRVQTSPLAPDAQQIGRLSEVAGMSVPPVFYGLGDSESAPTGFGQFLGFTVVLTGDASRVDQCLYVWDASTNPLQGREFVGSGRVNSGCGAGGFPPAAQFVLHEDAPDAALSEVGQGAAVQFVYDAVHQEVVVFALPAR